MSYSPASVSASCVVEQPPAGGQGDHAPLLAQLDRVDPVAGAQRRLDHVDAQHHPRPAAEWDVVDAVVLHRRRVAIVDRLDRVAERGRVGHVALGAEPVEPVREEREDVNLHRGTPGRRRRGGRRRRACGSRRRPSARAARSRRGARPRAPRRSGSSSIRRTVPTARSPSVTARPSSSCAHHSPSSSAGASASATRSGCACSASAASRVSQPASRTTGRSSVPTRRTISPRSVGIPSVSSRGRGLVTWKEPSRPWARPTRPASRNRSTGYSTMSTRTRRLSLTAAALTTVRSACAVRPPRPMMRP